MTAGDGSPHIGLVVEGLEPKLSQLLDFALATSRSPSLARLLARFDELLDQL
jgi:hypothetical protein